MQCTCSPHARACGCHVRDQTTSSAVWRTAGEPQGSAAKDTRTSQLTVTPPLSTSPRPRRQGNISRQVPARQPQSGRRMGVTAATKASRRVPARQPQSGRRVGVTAATKAGKYIQAGARTPASKRTWDGQFWFTVAAVASSFWTDAASLRSSESGTMEVCFLMASVSRPGPEPCEKDVCAGGRERRNIG